MPLLRARLYIEMLPRRINGSFLVVSRVGP